MVTGTELPAMCLGNNPPISYHHGANEQLRFGRRLLAALFDFFTVPTATFPVLSPRYMVRDRDGTRGDKFRGRVSGIGIDEVLTAPRSPWQNPC
jgi:hypothetical protein